MGLTGEFLHASSSADIEKIFANVVLLDLLRRDIASSERNDHKSNTASLSVNVVTMDHKIHVR